MQPGVVASTLLQKSLCFIAVSAAVFVADGMQDVVWASQCNSSITWAQNNNTAISSAQRFYAAQALASNASGVLALYIADVNSGTSVCSATQI